MHLPAYVITALFFGSAHALLKGFNAQIRTAKGACKTKADWIVDFNTIKSFPGDFDSIRLFSVKDCNALGSIAPAAIATGGKVFAGVSAQNPEIFEAEKSRLLEAVKKHGFRWLGAVSVGSGELDNDVLTADGLVEKIKDIRHMLSGVPGYTENVPVGHVDSWIAWNQNSNTPVIQACDFIGTNTYPRIQADNSDSIRGGVQSFYNSLNDMLRRISETGSRASVWVTEGEWPSAPYLENQREPDVVVAEVNWKIIACEVFRRYSTFWNYLQHQGNPKFGVLDSNGTPLYDLSC
ncbi:BgTH12-05443 [Blumeria graminis f. sp. triticale]|uniref:glucan endo-1,3-beta-D-glucosidase n=4 Tax=Blumeria graminis TaxID=34373 RepID=A0A656KUC1_BLUGR|nr:Endo-beta-13-glucanase [Blumeria graminis f. sp. tritici 96224]CAD6502854.1 BgTH12-05443 [Blumeria graminis f. sp. triticale]VDB88375.1 Bgt-848 [Blumeria graminis f. sp. tritici]